MTQYLNRDQCFSNCNIAFFPELKCAQSPLQLQYGGNMYTEMYLFSRPNVTAGDQGVDTYQTCKGYIAENADYPFISFFDRQPRIHTCFSYCIDGSDPLVIGETRSNCVDLPPSQRDQIICLYPEETCEVTSVESAIGVSGS